MSLYDSDEKVKKVIKDFTDVHQCERCKKVFTEIANVGVWDCKYHPGKFNYDTLSYECCGEKATNFSNYDNFAAYATWKHKFNPTIFSLGCKRCDHTSSKSKVPYEDVKYDDIAQLIPYMKPSCIARQISKEKKTFIRKEFYTPT